MVDTSGEGGLHKQNEMRGNQDTVDEYLPGMSKGLARAPLPRATGRIAESVVPYKCSFCVIGGVANGRNSVNDIWCYSMPRDSWFKVGIYPRNVQTPIYVLKADKELCATGRVRPGDNKS